ncbi:Sensor protein ZraS [compost metagenome]
MTRWHNKTAEGLFPILKTDSRQSIETLFGTGVEIFRPGDFLIHVGEGSLARSFELNVKNYSYFSRAAYLVSFRDVTEKIKEEAILIQQDRLASIGVLASGLAHEIGTPLGVIRGRAEMMSLIPGIPETIKMGADVITQQIDRVSQLVRGLLKLARGEENVSLQDIHLVSLLIEIQDFVRYDLNRQNIQLDISVDEHLEVRAVHSSLFQVFLNIIVNATHAIAHRRIEEPDLAGTVSITVQVQESFAVVSIADNGCGMDDNTMKKIFTPFFTTKEIGRGTGLGLAISYKIIQSWGGFIQVSSALGQGTQFQIYLPLK